MEYSVVIVGAGPSGATTALLLAQQGVKSLSISRHSGTANTPRAHIFNQRAMEVLRDAGIEEKLGTIASTAECMFAALGVPATCIPNVEHVLIECRYAAYLVAEHTSWRRVWSRLGLG